MLPLTSNDRRILQDDDEDATALRINMCLMGIALGRAPKNSSVMDQNPFYYDITASPSLMLHSYGWGDCQAICK